MFHDVMRVSEKSVKYLERYLLDTTTKRSLELVLNDGFLEKWSVPRHNFITGKVHELAAAGTFEPYLDLIARFSPDNFSVSGNIGPSIVLRLESDALCQPTRVLRLVRVLLEVVSAAPTTLPPPGFSVRSYARKFHDKFVQ